jgi:hypothetical protein
MNHVQIYTFWNLHEPSFDGMSHAYDFHSPRSNLRGFLKAAQDVGLFVNVLSSALMFYTFVTLFACTRWSLCLRRVEPGRPSALAHARTRYSLQGHQRPMAVSCWHLRHPSDAGG